MSKTNNKAIGWDIGIKNLAYCVLVSDVSSITSNTFVFDGYNYDITHWADISLVSQIESNLAESGQISHINNTITCCAIKTPPAKKSKSKIPSKKSENIPLPEAKVCGNTAFYALNELTPTGEYKGLCKTHYKKQTELHPLPELSVKKCWNEDCSSKPIQVLKNHIFKGYCKKHINEMHKAKTHTETDFYKINHSKTTAKIDINHLGIALFKEMDKRKIELVSPDIILLENQPVLKNPTMKSMQMFIYSYYLMNMIELKNISLKTLQCYCASKKLDLIKYLPDLEQIRILDIISKVKNSYQKNKKMSILIVEVILQSNKKWLEYFKSHPKQDDLADSLLMTLHYFTRASVTRASVTRASAPRAPLTLDTTFSKSCQEPLKEKKAKCKVDSLKPSKIPIVDAESSFALDEVKSKKRNRIINNTKHKKYSDNSNNSVSNDA